VSSRFLDSGFRRNDDLGLRTFGRAGPAPLCLCGVLTFGQFSCKLNISNIPNISSPSLFEVFTAIMDKFLTTSEVARICGVAHTTVIRWITEGKLKAHETPGGHRRIDQWDMVAFLRQFKIPVPPSLGDNRFKILEVDDDPKVLSMMRRAFAKHAEEIDFQTAANGMEALVMLGQNHFDLVTLDVVMPDMDGVQVCITLKQNPFTANVKIIVITGHQLSEEQEEYLKRNVECVFRKPFSPSVLLEKVLTLA
jgi:two-component system, OmpR family, response regulator VicR